MEKITAVHQTYRILQIRGMQVMLDKDLAHWYGTETKRLIEQVKRNIDRFPSHFMFQLNDEESSSLRSQIASLNNDNKSHSKRGMHSKYNSYVFTEHGVAMLSSVIKSKIAIQVNIQIINAFIAFRSNSFAPIITNPNDESLKIISRRLDEHQERIQLILNQLNPIEQSRQGIFFNDQIFDAYVFSSNLITSAKKSIVLIDNYIDETTLLQLSKRNANVNCIIYTEKINPQLKLDLDKHNSQYPSIEIRIIKNVHDRFLILDNQSLYHLGASLKDLGKRWFAFSRMDGLLEDVMKRLP